MYLGASMWFLARAKIDAGDHAAARAHLKEVLVTLPPSRYRWFFPRVWEGIGHLAAAEGEPARALRLAGAAAALRAVVGAGEAPPFRAYVERRLERAWRTLGEKADAKAFEEGQALTPEDALSVARQAVGTIGSLLSAREVEVYNSWPKA
jgi:hypothetical protein